MSSQVMDPRTMSSPSSYFFDEIRHPPSETQVGFWNHGTMLDHLGIKSVQSPPLEKLVPERAHAVELLEFPQPYLLRDQVAKLSLEQQVVEAEKMANLSMTSWRTVGNNLGTRSNLVQPASYLRERNEIYTEGRYENGLFSRSLSDIFDKKLKLSKSDVLYRQSVNSVTSHCDEEEPFESLEEIEAQTIGSLLPDDEDLLSGVNYNLEYIAQPNVGDDIEDFDLFSSGGGMELEDDGLNSSHSLRNSDFSGTNSNGQQGGLNSSIAGNPYGEHPSRTLFVRNINSNIEDCELKNLFEQYGDIRTLYTACKHRGFVMISYYDIRAASDAMRTLQNKPLRLRNLDIHFSNPKDNPSEKDVNHGTLLVFNLDFSVSNDELSQTFGVYGEIKEIRESPYKRHHKVIEFYDVRAAEAALRALNRNDIAGKQIRVEPAHPGNARQCSSPISSAEQEQGELTPHLERGSPLNSTTGCFRPVSHGAITSSCIENASVQAVQSSIRIGVPISQFMENGFDHSLPPSVPHRSPSLMSITPYGNQSGLGEPSITLGKLEFGFQGKPPFHPHSLPGYNDGLACGITYNSPGTNISSGEREGITNAHIHRVRLSAHAVEPSDGVFGSGNESCPLHGQQYMWRNTSSYSSHPPDPLMWPDLPSYVNDVHSHPSPQLHGLPRTPSHMLNAVLPSQHHHPHHVGSAPIINPSFWDRQHVYEAGSHEASSFHAGSLGSTGLSGDSNLHHLELPGNIFAHGSGNCMDLSVTSTNVGLHSPQKRYHMLPRRHSMIHMTSSFDANGERAISRRNDVMSSQGDNRKQYDLDIDVILRGEDTRTTLMIKNIPNKYTSKMLLAAIDEHHRGTYDFIYLPIDFKNKCNVGYAFINMINPSQIVLFYQAFSGKKWEKFNSEKVASLAYARIQGKAALVAHFQNSSLMNEDKRCRPILFHTDGPNAGDQEPFPMGVNIRPRPGKSRNSSSEENHQGSHSTCEKAEKASSIKDSSSCPVSS